MRFCLTSRRLLVYRHLPCPASRLSRQVAFGSLGQGKRNRRRIFRPMDMCISWATNSRDTLWNAEHSLVAHKHVLFGVFGRLFRGFRRSSTCPRLLAYYFLFVEMLRGPCVCAHLPCDHFVVGAGLAYVLVICCLSMRLSRDTMRLSRNNDNAFRIFAHTHNADVGRMFSLKDTPLGRSRDNWATDLGDSAEPGT